MTVSRAPPGRESRTEVRTRLVGARLRAWLARLLRRRAAAPADEAFDAFISYSHRSDAQLAAALKRGLHRFARPWYRVRALHVFLDNTNLSANPDLWASITQALGAARHLVLLASPDAAASEWVNKELREWRESRPVDRLVLVLTAGELRWDDAAQDFDWPASSAVPRALAGAFDAEPRWIDLRFARALEAPSLRDPRFRSGVADLAAPLHGRAKEELVGDDVREHRRTMRIARAAVVLLVALTAAASFAALTAVRQRDRAEQQLRLATSRLLSAEASAGVARQHSQALLLALEAHAASPTAEARAALYGGLVRLPQALRYLQPRSGGPQRIALSPDGRTLVAGTTGGALELFDTRSGRRTRTLALGEGTVSDLAFAPAGDTVAAVDGTGAVRLVESGRARTRGPLPALPGGARTNAVAFGPRRLLAAGSSSGELWLWDTDTRRRLAGPFGRHPGGITDVAVSPGGELVAASGQDARVSVWRLGPTPRLETTLAPGEGRAAAVQFSPDGRRLAASAQNGAVALWSTEGWRAIGSPSGHPGGEATALTFTPDGALLASGGFDNAIRLWDTRSGEPRGRPLRGHIAFISDLAAPATGRLLASAGADGNIALWDPRRHDRLGRPLAAAGERPVTALAAQRRRDPHGVGRPRADACSSAPGNRPESCSASLRARRFARSPSAPTAAAWRQPPAHGFARLRTAFTSSTSAAAGGSAGRCAHAPTPAGSRSRPMGAACSPPALASWSASSCRPAAALEPAWAETASRSAPTGACWRRHTVAQTRARCCCATCAMGRAAGRLQTGSAAYVWDVAFSPDGGQVAAGDDDGNIVLWDLATRRRLGEPLTGHRSRVEFIEFSPAGDLLASSDSAGAMLLWDLESRRALGPAVPGRRPTFAAGGELLASLADGGGVSVRPLDPAGWQAAACALSNRNLGAREWAQFMGSDPYEPTCPGRERGHAARVAVSAH